MQVSRMTRIRFFGLVLLFGVVHMPVHAQRATVAVLGYHRAPKVNEQQLQELAALIRQQLQDDPRFLVVDEKHVGERLRSRSHEVVERSFLSNANRYLDEGRIFYENADPEAAVESLSKADAERKSGMVFVHDERLTYLVHLYLGLSLYSVVPMQASWYFEIAARTDPDAQLDPARFPPNVIDAYNSAREKALYWAPALLKIHASGDPADVFLDGIFQGRTPIELKEVVPGPHWLLVERPGGSRWMQEVQIESDQKYEFNADLRRVGLTRSDGSTPDADGHPDVRNLYTALAGVAGTDYIVMIAGQGDGSAVVQLLSEASKRFGPPVQIPLDNKTVRDEKLATLVTEIAQGTDVSLGTIDIGSQAKSAPVFLGRNQLLNDLILGQRAFSAVLAAEAEAAAEQALEKPPVHKRPGFWLTLLFLGGLAGAGVSLGITQPWVQEVEEGTLHIPIP